ncbi:hypothetical protein C8Q80DRAFT_362362 [Daedaleopsis nitida]|nr:hypothetical protein C8Q80DRAFT_362362 [Daedaleopsis nitida]
MHCSDTAHRTPHTMGPRRDASSTRRCLIPVPVPVPTPYYPSLRLHILTHTYIWHWYQHVLHTFALASASDRATDTLVSGAARAGAMANRRGPSRYLNVEDRWSPRRVLDGKSLCQYSSKPMHHDAAAHPGFQSALADVIVPMATESRAESASVYVHADLPYSYARTVPRARRALCAGGRHAEDYPARRGTFNVQASAGVVPYSIQLNGRGVDQGHNGSSNAIARGCVLSMSIRFRFRVWNDRRARYCSECSSGPFFGRAWPYDMATSATAARRWGLQARVGRRLCTDADTYH